MSIITFLSQQSGIEWAAVIFSIIYVILAARENIWCWVFGFLSVVFYFIVFVEVQLYSDATLQVFYMGMSVYGWWSWRKQATREVALKTTAGKQSSLSITTMPLSLHGLILFSGVLLALLLGFFWQYMGAALPFIDAHTTSFSVIATILVARKKLENWLYWIVIDLVCVGVYIFKEIYLTAILFLIYTVIAVFGYIKWRQRLAGKQ